MIRKRTVGFVERVVPLSAYDNIKGMSGGGLFYKQDNNFYLAGILMDFKEKYKDFISIGISKVNEFLSSNNIPQLPTTYATPSGINEIWIRDHLNQARENLGERYTKEVENFEVPEATYFNYLALGDRFKDLVKEAYHNVIEEVRKYNYFRDHQSAESIKKELEVLFTKIISNYENYKWDVNNLEQDKINLNDIIETIIPELIQKIENWEIEVWDQIRNQKDDDKKNNNYSQDYLFEELDKLEKIKQALSKFKQYLKDDYIKLAFNPKLIVTGKAGSGKSHLLGDVVMTRLTNNLPSILVLGNLMRDENNAEKQILKLLNLNCSFNKLLDQLNKIGEYIGERIFFAIDALNEGNGRNFWKDEIAGFINKFSNYPFIGLILSVRSSYIEDILPAGVIDSTDNVQIQHHGFQGKGLEAIQHFCNCFELNAPTVPLLTPEFDVPQFLLLTCKALKAQNKKDFPKGVAGITEIYSNYTEALSQKFADKNKRVQLPSFDIVSDAINYLLKLGYQPYKYNEVIKHFENYNNGHVILNFLLRENILTDEKVYFGGTEGKVSIVRFSYEGFANHFQVRNLLNGYSNDNIKNLVAQNSPFYKLNRWGFPDNGMLETLAIQVPQKFDVELYELFDETWLKQFCKGDVGDHSNWLGYDYIEKTKRAWINSIPWRDSNSIDLIKAKTIIKKYLRGNDWDDLFNNLIAVAPIANHPLNAMFLHQFLERLTMPERDAFWIEFTCIHFDNKSSSISRLIEWILDFDECENMLDKERRLACIILSWMLTTSYHALRDASTLCILKLLNKNLNVAIPLLEAFKDIEEPHIQERIYAAVYGAVVRSKDSKNISTVALFVYDEIFASDNPPIDVILRDYARSVIEYALYLNPNLSVDIEIEKINPPYRAVLPSNLPAKKDVECYEIQWSNDFSFAEKEFARTNYYLFKGFQDYEFNRSSISFKLKNFYDSVSSKNVDSNEFCYWLLRRVFELGYNNVSHGGKIRYSESSDHYKYGGFFHPINKKYIHIASNKLLARFADNCQVKYSEDCEENNYHSPRQSDFYPPNFDPTILYYSYNKKANRPSFEYDKWFENDWLESKSTWPKANDIIECIKDKSEWLQLVCFNFWQEPIKLGVEKYSYKKSIRYWLKSYLVEASDFETVLRVFNKRKWRADYELPYDRRHIFYREYYWSRVYKSYNYPDWLDDYDEEVAFKLHIPTEDYKLSGSNFQSSCRLQVLSNYLYKGLNLQFGNKYGTFINQKGEVVAYSKIGHPKNFWIRKDLLFNFLKANNLRIVFAIKGEKISDRDTKNKGLQFLLGTYYLNEDGVIEGTNRVFDDYYG